MYDWQVGVLFVHTAVELGGLVPVTDGRNIETKIDANGDTSFLVSPTARPHDSTSAHL